MTERLSEGASLLVPEQPVNSLTAPEDGASMFNEAKLARLLVNSFRLSRGNASLQNDLLRFLAITYGSQIDRSILPAVIARANAQALAYYTNSALHPEKRSTSNPKTDVMVEVSDAAKGLVHALDNRQPLDRGLLYISIISTDYDWRPEVRKNRTRYQPVKPYSSNLVSYGFLGKTTGVREFDPIFQLAADFLVAGKFRTAAEYTFFRTDSIQEIIDDHLANFNADRDQLKAKLAGTALGHLKF